MSRPALEARFHASRTLINARPRPRRQQQSQAGAPKISLGVTLAYIVLLVVAGITAAHRWRLLSEAEYLSDS